MDINKVETFLATNAEKFPVDKINIIKEQLEKVNEDKLFLISTAKYKDPNTMLILSIFVGAYGVDRFLIGDTTMGILKLLTGGGCGIWTIIDWFSIKDKTRDYNFKTLIKVIDPTNQFAYTE